MASAEVRLESLSPAARLATAAASLDAAERRLARAAISTLARRRERLEHLAARWRSVGPSEVLSRGYALVLDEHGRPIRDADQVPIGGRVTATLARGAIRAIVESKETDPAPDES